MKLDISGLYHVNAFSYDRELYSTNYIIDTIHSSLCEHLGENLCYYLYNTKNPFMEKKQV